ncbi:MAG TPA: heme ABC exporter ATP-binding protein CcmA [Rhizomicrobium sp.]
MQSIEASCLTCVRGGRVVFRDVSFRVRAGEALTIEGANGSGKTSLLRMIAGFLAPQAGSIVLARDGTDIADGEERGKHIGWLGHQDGVKPQMTPVETLRFFANLYGVVADASAALDSVGLARAAELPCRYLSAGQKKRLALARLKISARPLWLLDEPLSALDTQGKALLRDLIERHCASGGMAIAATHEPLDVDCARLVLA